MNQVKGIYGESRIYNHEAFQLLDWAVHTKNRIKAHKLIKIATKLENRYRKKHYWAEDFDNCKMNPLIWFV